MLGKRIRLFRSRKGLKQKELGEMVGFMGKTSDVRIAQYETEARTPKDDLIKQLADIFGVTTRAITVPNCTFGCISALLCVSCFRFKSVRCVCRKDISASQWIYIRRI